MAWPPDRVVKGDHFTRFSSHRNYPQGSCIRPDELTGETVVLLPLGVCGWGYAWRPILGVDWS
jgi:hypothetical protein